jgi:putative peptide zinc metalloprotease protein
MHWVLLVDEPSRRVHRIDAAGWAFVGLCNGERSVEAIWEAVMARGCESALTQDEVVVLLTQLHEAGLMHVDLSTEAAALHRRAEDNRRKQRLGAINPFAFKLPLGDPSALLDRIAPATRWLFSVPMLLAWVALLGAALIVAIGHAGALAQHAAQWLPTQHYLMLIWLAYPPMKALHELAHALAVRRFGGDVREVGATFLLLTPVPYVDASAANAFGVRAHRVLVSAAGIMAELALASIALLVWVSVEDGLLRDVAFACLFIGTASTLLVNGNPLVRMDGYHVVTDAFDVTNLADRSASWWRSRLLGLFTGQREGGPVPGRGEAYWLMLYAPASWIYRAVLAVWVVGWLGSVQAWLGYAAALLMGWQLIGMPLAGLHRLLAAPGLADSMRRTARRRVVALVGGGGVLLAGVPLPDTTTVQGVVWLPENAWVRAGTDGFVERVRASDGSLVSKGAPVVDLVDDQVQAERAEASERLESLKSQYFGDMMTDSPRLGALGAQASAAAGALQELDERIAALEVTAPADGRLVLDDPADLPGRWIPRGTTIGYVLPASNRTVRIALPHEEALRAASELRGIELRTFDAPSRVLQAVPRLVVPSATHRLPSRALGTGSGGAIVLDPADPDQMTARDPIATIDVESREPLGPRIGTRVWVRLVHTDAPLLQQGLRHLRQLVLGHFRAE